MNYKKVLEKLGLIENTDFALTAESFIMLPKTHTVEIQPAVYGEDGSLISEAVTEEQAYTPSAPSVDAMTSAWEVIQIQEYDITYLIEYYLADKVEMRDFEYDSLAVQDGLIQRWDFKQVPQPTNAQLVALIPLVQAKRAAVLARAEKLEKGKKAREICENALDIIAGFNIDRVLTSSQITQMQQQFGTIETLLRANRPASAKPLIEAIVPDGDLITQEMKEMVLAELA